MFQKKTPNLPTWKTVTAEKRFIHQIDWWTFLLLVEQVSFSPFYFFWLICTFQAERHKSVFHSHVLKEKSLNARLYLLLCLSPLSYRKCPCLIKMLDMIDCSFLGFFLTPSQGSWTLLGSTFNNTVFSRGKQTEKRTRLWRWFCSSWQSLLTSHLWAWVKGSKVLAVACSEGLTEQGSAQQDLNKYL